MTAFVLGTMCLVTLAVGVQLAASARRLRLTVRLAWTGRS